MAKHRKTRQEKMLADQRHVLYHIETSSAPLSAPSEKKQDYNLSIPVNKVKAVSYTHVAQDLRKTAIVTASIIIAQIVLFIALNRI